MTEDSNQPSQADGERQKHRLLQNFIFYGVAAFFLFLALTGSARFSLNIGLTVLVCALAWWSVLIFFWSSPAFCHFETEHDWWVMVRGQPLLGKRLLLSSLWVAIYWPLLIPKRFYFRSIIVGVCIYYALKTLANKG